MTKHRIDFHFGWAMAVGGMIGGGIYTLAGVILGVAGPLAWLSLVLGSILALITVYSYYRLTMLLKEAGVPVTLLVREGHPRLAVLVTWWLIFVYLLAMAVYTFTFGHYVGRALGLSEGMIALCIVLLNSALLFVNLMGIKEPAGVQITAVWIELFILALLAGYGIWHWNPQNLVQGVPRGSAWGVLSGMASTFIAFEGFEMLSYDYRELSSPKRIMSKGLAAAVLAVGLAYALVTIGAGSLVGASVLVEKKENALAVAGAKAAGTTGLIIVTIAACASAASAVNATLFSVARLAREAADKKLIPAIFGRCNRKECPHYSIIFLAVISSALATASTLEVLVEAASLAFLSLFCYVNALAYQANAKQNWLSLIGAISAAGAAIIVAQKLAITHPLTFAGLLIAVALSALLYFIRWRLRIKALSRVVADEES